MNHQGVFAPRVGPLANLEMVSRLGIRAPADEREALLLFFMLGVDRVAVCGELVVDGAAEEPGRVCVRAFAPSPRPSAECRERLRRSG
jgi:hypothetical protein